MAFKIGQHTTLRASLWKGVKDVSNPYAVPPSLLARLRGCYIPEPQKGGSPRALPGFQLQNSGAQLGADSGHYGQGMGIGTTDAGVEYNFVVAGGTLYRVSSDFGTRTDVTPAGVTIDPDARVFIVPFSNRIIVNDGVNTPWIGSDLSATPITQTDIDYTGDAVAWVAYGPPAVYDDALVFLVRSRSDPAVYRTLRIGWSFTDDPTLGYQQSAYDYEWDVVQNGTNPIYALWGDNLELKYFRNDSIGYLTGTIGTDFQTTSAHDSLSDGVGTRAPASLAAFGESNLFFVDEMGRPYRLSGGRLEPLWEQMERVVTKAPTGWTDKTERTACGAILPQLNLYAVAIWADDPSQSDPQFPTVLYLFDAKTGIYMGERTIGPGVAIHAIGLLVGADSHLTLAVLGGKVAPTNGIQAPGEGGYLWTLSRLEDGLWTDNGEVPDIFAQTPPMGYSEDVVLNIDRVVAVVEALQTDTTPTAITISPAGLALTPGQTAVVTAVTRNAAGGIVEHLPVDLWSSSDPSVATVVPIDDFTATVTGVADTGTSTLTAQVSTGLVTPLVSSGITIHGVSSSDPVSASGGTETDSGGYHIHTFDSSGTLTVTTGGVVDVLVVGGGGAGAGVNGTGIGGGGGGGGRVIATSVTIPPGDIAITIGAGGVGATSGPAPLSGDDSSFGDYVVAPGGGAGNALGTRNGYPGGSGGGAGTADTDAGTGGAAVAGSGSAEVDGAGYAGGNGYNDHTGAGGGGGGAGGVGAAGGLASGAGNGGPGLSNDYSGTATHYGAGGGGGSGANGSSHVGTGGTGGGGNGSSTGDGGNGTANTGSGGGGSGGGSGRKGGSGGSGIVIVRYLTS